MAPCLHSHAGSKLLAVRGPAACRLICVASRSRRPKLVVRSSHQDAAVAIPPPDPTPPPSPLSSRPLTWAVGAGLLTLALATLSLGRALLRSARDSGRKAPPKEALSAADSATLAVVGPLLLAAETGAGLDETASLSLPELQKLELNLRMLITTMEAQMSELQDTLAAAMPPLAAAALDTALEGVEAAEQCLADVTPGDPGAAALEQRVIEARWACFAVLQPHAGDAGRRTYRSLMYNLTVQRELLGQVGRQMAMAEKMAVLEQQMAALQGQDAPSQLSSTGAPSPSSSRPAALRVAAGGAGIPHPQKADTGGEDAFFVGTGSSEGCVFGVADGVGGWAAQGVDPAQYPRLLIAAVEREVQAGGADPQALLVRAYETAHAPGSCTLALAAVRGGTLHLASVGDCAVRVVRGSGVAFASQVQEHAFNQPLQLASPTFGGSSTPADAVLCSVPLERGDVVVLGSDGLFDNLWDRELVELVDAAVASTSNSGGGLWARQEDAEGAAAEVAARLVAAAAANSTDPSYRSPYAAEKHERLAPALLRGLTGGATGGKPDDVTTVVALIY